MLDVNWRELRRVRMWTPLAKLPYSPERLGNGVYKLGRGAYAVAGPWVPNWRYAPGELRVLSLRWASCDSAAVMIASSETTGIGPFPAAIPPEELLDGRNPTYAALVRMAVNEEEIGSGDAGFLARVVHSEDFSYYFRSRRRDPDEVPFAIAWILPAGVKKQEQ